MSKSYAGGLLLIRLVVGLFLIAHGFPKLLHFPSFAAKNGGDAIAACAVAGELGGGLGLLVGLLTRFAGLGVALVMGYIAFHLQRAHLGQIGQGGGTSFEYPFVLGAVGLAFFLMGPGDYSLDRYAFAPPKER